MKRKMIIHALVAVAASALLAGCVETPQFKDMPEGRVQSFSYYSARDRVAFDESQALYDISLWREDSLETGGLLYCKGEDEVGTTWGEMPQPIVVGEEVFDSVRHLIETSRLYSIQAEYSTFLKGDAYAYVPWDLDVEFSGGARLKTHSDGTSPSCITSDQFWAVMKYLQGEVGKRGLAWLAQQPIDLGKYNRFANLGYVLEQPYEEGGEDEEAVDERPKRKLPLTFSLRRHNSEDVMQHFTLQPAGRNRYVDKQTGQQLELRWVSDELMLTCHSRSGEPLWAMCAHESSWEGYRLERLLKHFIQRTYTDGKGRTVTIDDDRIKGFEGRKDERCVLMPYRKIPAERIRVGEYPDEERFYAFRRSRSGINIYATRDDSDEDNYYDVVPTEPIALLRFASEPAYDWLHSELLDTYILRYYAPEERRHMQDVVEKAANPTPEDEWNLWLLREFGGVIPFEPEADFRR